MADYMAFWWSKFLVDIMVSLGVFAFIFGVYLIFVLKDKFDEFRCKHEHYRENRQCDAICSDCGKNLGFIKTVQAERNSKKR